MRITVRDILLVLPLVASNAFGASVPTNGVELTRTAYGVVHVRADNFRGMAYGLAYAYAQDNLCMFADSVLTARGERSKFFGPKARATKSINGEYGVASAFLSVDNEESDFFFKGYLDPAQLSAGYALASPEARELLSGYVAGYNRYLSDNAGKFPAACKDAKWVRPITVEDMHLVLADKALHASGEIFAREIVNGARAAPKGATAMNTTPVTQWDGRTPDVSFVESMLAAIADGQLGSNGLALGKDTTVNGRGLLLGNPHFPWTSTDRFYQVHLTVPGKYDAMGVSYGPMPLVTIGFNKDVAWTHTVTTAKHFTTFRLALDPNDKTGTTYLYDGKAEKLAARTVTVERLQADGTTDKLSKTFYSSRHGAVIDKPDADMQWNSEYVYVLGDPNRYNTRMLDQWLGIATAHSVKEIKKSLDAVVGIPWVNLIAADRDGNTLFADASVVPHVTDEQFHAPCMIAPRLFMLDGSRGACNWGQDQATPAGIFSPANSPALARADYVGNSNDSYWMTNPAAPLTGPAPHGYSPMYGRHHVEQSLRTRIGFKQLNQALARSPKLGASDVQALMFANRVYVAELLLPELLQSCTASTDKSLIEACAVLKAWDKRADLDSRGAILFRDFWFRAARVPARWAVPFNDADPINTPYGLAPQAGEQMLAALRDAALGLNAKNIPLDARMGDYQDDLRHGLRVPIHGGYGNPDGVYNAMSVGGAVPDAHGYHNVEHGASYLQTVGFDASGPVAQAMLVYGQSTDPKSEHYADQLGLYSRKQWQELPFTETQIKADPQRKVTTLIE
ncbi:MAG: penicillin acylase family protein [Pseudomonadota bacterium]